MQTVLVSGGYRRATERLGEFLCRSYCIVFVPFMIRDLSNWAPVSAGWQLAKYVLITGVVYLLVRTLIDVIEDIIDAIAWFLPRSRLANWASLDIVSPESVRYDRDVDEQPLTSLAHRVGTFESVGVVIPLIVLALFVTEQMQFCVDRDNWLLSFSERSKCMLVRFAYGLGFAAIAMRNGAAAVPLAYRMFGVTSWRRRARSTKL